MPPSTRVTIESVPDESEFQLSIAELGLPFADNGLDDLDLLHAGRRSGQRARDSPDSRLAGAENAASTSEPLVTLEANIWYSNEGNRYIASITTTTAPPATSSSLLASMHLNGGARENAGRRRAPTSLADFHLVAFPRPAIRLTPTTVPAFEISILQQQRTCVASCSE
ncbi:hypothetical protein R3P38DRAFT_3362829 [Favolaschia claudopus]|uniref:Uncharacterized protein n=1 Tax=Favolaschia claudopus TaxID=2862362 RepID=A0AAW0AKS7_9AGAR